MLKGLPLLEVGHDGWSSLYGEKNTKYFLSLEKRNRENNLFKSIKNAQGALLTKQASVLKELSFYYESLCRDNNKQYSENQTYDLIKLVSLPTLDETHKAQCETPTKHECLTATVFLNLQIL